MSNSRCCDAPVMMCENENSAYLLCSKCNLETHVILSDRDKKKDLKMPMFSQESFSKLSTCHIDLQALFFEVIRHVDCKVLEGYRNEADQNAAFASGHSKLKYPDGKHNHQPSYAVDVAPYPIPDWKNTIDFVYFAGFVMGIAAKLKAEGKITHEIRWGGDWRMENRPSENNFNDLLHFEIIL